MRCPSEGDDELLRLPPGELLRRLRKAESENLKLSMSHAALVNDINQRMQAQLSESRAAEEGARRLRDDNRELRDLCCFLDDERQRGRRVAREWQRFGRYTASVMRQEVAAYQDKLRELEARQQELLRDNLQLKKLCLCLDEERCPHRRDDDDTADFPGQSARSSVINAQVLQYIKSLEKRVKDFEDAAKIRDMANNEFSSVSKPEAVVHALKVLEVHDQMDKESEPESEELVHGERMLVREMCNVVWRKLEDGTS